MFWGSEQSENVNIIGDEYAAFPTVAADRRIVEIAVEGTEDIGSAYNRDVNNWIVVGVRWHNTGSRTRENDLCYVLCSKIAEVFGYLLVREFG